ncbi:MAG: DUF2905 domain-containing protein, partial [Thermodesulfovibrionales bacterium]|nr:DUF2905 domain-containing protein [Thermodesulfovibrionales bacterium]
DVYVRRCKDMDGLDNLGKLLVIIGIVSVVIGLLLIFSTKIPFLGKLPGDIMIKKEGFTFYFPIATSILISIILSLFFWLFRR